ncbi:MAG: trigger factor [Acutalibacteraceae bacterium]|nr:trigger factor [Acutalibacteraceae bacterium]
MSLKAKKEVEKNRYELEVVVDAVTFAAACEQAYKKNAKKITLPGFRKGKAPRVMIEKMYGKDFFYEDALNIVYPDAVESAIKEAELEIVSSNIGFDLVSLSEEGADFKVTITVKPEVELKAYKGLKATKKKVSVTAKEVDEEVNRVAERNSRLVSVEDRAAQNDDTVVIDYEGFVGDVAFEGGKAEGYSLKLGSGSFIPGFEDQIVGHNTGDEFDVNVKFPDEYHAEDLKGKDAVFKCKLHEIKFTELPVIDDEFAKDVSEFDTLADYKADIKKKMTENKKKQADSEVESQLIDALVENLVAEIPADMFETRIDENIQDFGYRLQMQGMDLDTYVKYMGGDMAAFRDSFREQSEKQVKVRLALEKVAQLENIEISEKEIEEQYQKFADMYKMEIEKVQAAVSQNDVVNDLKVEAAIKFIKDNAEITEGTAAKKPANKKPAAKKTAEKKDAE